MPPRWTLAAIGLLAFVALAYRRLRWVGFVLLGFAWCAFRAGLVMDARLPTALEGVDLTVVGVIDALPKRRDDGTRFVLRIESARRDDEPLALSGPARITWYDDAPADLAACERWEQRRHGVERAMAATDDEPTRAAGRDYLAALDAYAAASRVAGATFVEIQHTLLFATVGQRGD